MHEFGPDAGAEAIMVTEKIDVSSTVAIAATFTADPLLPALEYLFREAGLDLTISLAPYHQVLQELVSGSGTLSANPKGVNTILVRLEDYVRDFADPVTAVGVIASTADEISGALVTFVRRCKVPTIVALFPPSASVVPELSDAVLKANLKLTDRVKGLAGVSLLAPKDIEAVSGVDLYDAVSDGLAHIPFTDAYYCAIALALARKAHVLLVPERKVLVLDCDNTLWRGVVGEDGVDGIGISAGFAALQRFAVRIQAQGGLVCLSSKNSERDVLDVFSTRSDMVLKLEHIVAHRINWGAKPDNIAALAHVLNLGLDSFVFIDDNPVECELVRAQLPQVLTLLLPPEDKIESFLSHLWVFDKAAVTDEDVRRTSLYREEAARKEHEKAASNVVDFVASLKVVVDIASPEEADWPRLAQLTQRTNQFNFTTMRRTETDLRQLGDPAVAKQSGVLGVRVNDRFGDYGLVGLVTFRVTPEALVGDSFMLSCRVLGRGVEHAILRHLGIVARQIGCDEVCVPFVRSERNEPAWAFAESVAARYRTGDGDHHIYRIPTAAALEIVHRPGHDPDAVIKARDSEGRKAKSHVPVSNVSERYTLLSQKLLTGQDVLDAMSGINTRKRTLPGVPVPPSSETERKMLMLWQEVLAMPDLGVEDDYSSVGGTSLLAARLFARVTQHFGVKLPLTTILDAPTVRQLLRVIESEQPNDSGLINLRPGARESFFFVHDGDGETLLYQNLARRLPNNFAVFGIEPRQLGDIPLAHTRLEDMAAHYVRAVRQRQPNGPYFLGGMCAGGVIAYEMARQLEGSGEDVALVALLDAVLPKTPKHQGRIAKQRIGRLTQLFKDGNAASNPIGLASAAFRKVWNAAAWETVQRLRRSTVQLRFRLLKFLLSYNLAWPRPFPALTVRQIYDAAESSYVPKPLASRGVVLLRANAGEGGDTPFREIYSDESLGWRRVASQLSIEDVDGGHFSMLQEPYAKTLATKLTAYLTSPSARTETEHLLKARA